MTKQCRGGFLQSTLERAGYEVIAVENGRQAADQICTPDGPRLAFAGLAHARTRWAGVCREVRKRKEQSYVYMVLITSKEAKEDVIAGLESGADDYLTKPFDPEELKARLRTGCGFSVSKTGWSKRGKRWRFKASHDALTTLWNRAVILELLERELSRSHRENATTVIILCDIDHFKDVNDTFGHLIGDELLRETSKRLLASVRSYDFVGATAARSFSLS